MTLPTGAPEALWDVSFLPSAVSQALGQISASSFALLAVPVLLGVVLALHHRMRLHRRELRREILNLRPGPRFSVMDAMIHCLRVDGKIHDRRLSRALEIGRATTDMNYAREHLQEAALRADRITPPRGFAYLGQGLTQDERMVAFNAAVSVLLADGSLTPADRRLLGRLSRGLRLHRRDLRALGRLIPA
jgi:hypothetical protein